MDELPQEAFDGLHRFLPKPSPDGSPTLIRLRDAEFLRITEWCEKYNRAEWGRRPRTFALLYMIGCAAAIKEFVKKGLSDIAFPYSEDNLPWIIKGRERKTFLELQHLVLTGQALALETPGSAHQHFADRVDDLFHTRGALGKGFFGIVDHVTLRLGTTSFARKQLLRKRFFQDDQDQLRTFENELETFKYLSHEHLVRLVSSYTDVNHVGLLMTPVADCNLSEFMGDYSGTTISSKKHCIRDFFGCLANAVRYLHKSRVKHRDISLGNILVKGTKVYLTDFGTSRSWKKGGVETSDGTAQGFTPPYCAPEVSGNSARNNMMDIWSLGCVYLEMCAFLVGKSVKDMRKFFETHGTKAPYVNQNPTAMQLWVTTLTSMLTQPGDRWPLELAQKMCSIVPASRPEAAQVVSEIRGFPGELRYYCTYCESEFLRQPKPREITINISDALAEENSSGSADKLEHELKDVRCDTHVDELLPDSQDVETKCIAPLNNGLMKPTKDPVPDPDLSPKDLISTSDLDHGTLTAHNQLVSCRNPSPDSQSESRSTSNDYCAADSQSWFCPWPNCSYVPGLEIYIDSHEDFLTVLRAHLRKVHEVHDFGWTERYPRGTLEYFWPEQRVPDDGESDTNGSDSENENFEGNDLADGRTGSAKGLEVDNHQTTSLQTSVRFSALPEAIRPKNIETPKPPKIELFQHSLVRAEPIDGHDGDELPVQASVPSYILASSNSFMQHELLSRDMPLFVYGSCMFPAIIKGLADPFINEDGVYDGSAGRRLRTTAADWGFTNVSLESAAEQMAPAHLTSHIRFKPRGYTLAALIPNDYDVAAEAPVRGFAIFGLREEALKCLDYVFNSPNQQKRFRDRYAQSDMLATDSKILERRPVTITMGVEDGASYEIQATTYVWAGRSTFLNAPWNIDDFIRTDTYTGLAGERNFDEEERLAEQLKIKYTPPGGELCDAVLRNDPDRVRRLLEAGMSVNAQAVYYGTALHAAASRGNLAMVNLLLRRKADPNLYRGEYGYSLIASVVNGHKEITETLLEYGAKVLVRGGKYVSPIYQAIAFENLELTHMLLEKGAWLTKGYNELLDLAVERRNPKILAELEKYDVRGLHLQRRRMLHSEDKDGYYQLEATPANLELVDSDYESDGDSIRGRPETKDSQPIAARKSEIAMSGFSVAMNLRGTPGKWTGIKAVTVIKGLLSAGMSKRLLNELDNLDEFGTFNTFLEWVGRLTSTKPKTRPYRSGSPITANYRSGSPKSSNAVISYQRHPSSSKAPLL